MEELNFYQMRHILVDDKYKFLYCYVPKVGCSNWKRVLRVLGGQQAKVTNPLALHLPDQYKSLDKYSPKEINYRIRNYFNFMFVRDPLSRLVSAYRDKFYSGEDLYFLNTVSKAIIKYYKHTHKKVYYSGVKFTFAEFLHHVSERNVSFMNEHWRPISALCNPCKVAYDFVGSFESLNEDAEQVLRKLNISEVIEFPGKSRRYKSYDTEEFIKQVPRDLLQKALAKYSMDYKLFSLPRSC